jgi:L-lysine 2,3-aminomutase
VPHPAPGPAARSHSQPGFRVFTMADLDQLTARAGLPPARRLKIQAAAAVTGFRVTSYVTDELIDWSAAPDDPIYRLYFPDEDVLAGAGAGPARQTAPGPRAWPAAQQAGSRPAPGRLRPGDPALPGVRRVGHDSVLVVPARAPASRCYAITCPGRTWPAPGHGPAMSADGIPRLTAYLAAHPEVTSVQLTGGDPLMMGAAALRRHVEPLLAVEQLASIRISTSALACWPHRFLNGPDGDADDTLRLFGQVCAAGKNLTLMAGFCHPRELEPAPAGEAARRIRDTGALICTQAPVAGSVNDAASIWAAMWRTQVRMGMVPGTMNLSRVTGPGRHFTVPLARAHRIFTRAYAGVTGLARTVRGPAMRDEHGTVCIDGTAVIGTQEVFVLRYIQARDPHLIGALFFAAFDPGATWLTELKPAQGLPADPRRP